MYTIVIALNCAVIITKQNENILSLQGVISKNRPSPLENWDVSHACTQMYNFWGVFIQVILGEKKARLTSFLNMQLNRKKIPVCRVINDRVFGTKCPKKGPWWPKMTKHLHQRL